MIKTKIIATVGPASRDAETVGRLIRAGVDVFRLNFSHGSHGDHAAAVEVIRDQADRLHECVAILGDLGGPKIRLGEVAGGEIPLPAGGTLIFQRDTVVAIDPEADGQPVRVSCTYPRLVDDVDLGEAILIADGRIRCTVTEKRADEIVCRVDVGGTLASRKGVNLPQTRISSPAVTEKDQRDLAWAVEHGVDFLALSFVRSADDVRGLKQRLADLDADIPVVAKIEKPQALDEIDAIIAASDAVMVARGDLGVELELARVPLVQKDITRRCHATGTPVIIATQMLSSMTDRPSATRAEVSDVANAVFDQADACMLSEETAIGSYPIAAVETMAEVALRTEAYLQSDPPPATRLDVPDELAMPAGVAAGAATITAALGLRCVVCWTASGTTAQLLSKQRLGVPVLGFSHDAAAANRMALYYGVYPHRSDRPGDDAEMLAVADREAIAHGLADAGDLVLVVSGTKLTTPGQTNALMVHRVRGEDT